ncbi:hypothetical protein N9Z03_01285 [Akkermansiaceae bacterium]|nr:hypothetical protein [Akkermansiaceae bacterium]
MWVPAAQFDVVHIQWPEALFNWLEPTAEELHLLEDTIRRWKQHGTTIVVTIHNEFPHGRDTDVFRRLYEIVYRAADGFIHLGESSILLLERRFASEIEGKSHRVILHGDYSWYPNSLSKEEAREKLGIPKAADVILAIGKIRSHEEFEIATKGFQAARLSDAVLLVAGRLFHQKRTNLRHWSRRWLFRSSSRHFRLDEGHVPAVRIQEYLNAADVLLITRVHNINSGNVALGFHFGKTVVGPDYAVIGEQLRETGNPVYCPRSMKSVGNALEEGVLLAKAGQGDSNREWARVNMNWKIVSEQHVEFYQTLLGQGASIVRPTEPAEYV